MEPRIRMLAQLQPWTRKVLLQIGDFGGLVGNPGGKIGWASQIVMTTFDEGSWPEPPLALEYTAAQELMDELWKCGLRPSEGTGSAGALAAVEKHLADMRDLVFSRVPGGRS